MADYIDRDELIKALKKEFRQNDYIKHDSYFEFKNIVESQPVIEQKHGHWQVVKECEAYFNECSNCKGRLWEVEPEWIFCPYCACKMDEVTEL